MSKQETKQAILRNSGKDRVVKHSR